jgi:hypothetical protein
MSRHGFASVSRVFHVGTVQAMLPCMNDMTPTTRTENEMDGLEKERARLVAARDAAERRYEMSIALLADATQRRREACDEANAAALSVYDFDVAQGAD